MIRCVIIDDEKRSINLIKAFLTKISILQVVGESTNPLEGVEIITREKPDVVFLDIEMPGMSGLDVAKIVRHLTRIIFCTAHSQFAFQSYEVEAVDFLKKPIAFDRFEHAIHKLGKSMAVVYTPTVNLKRTYMFVRAEKKGVYVKVDFCDINYIKAVRNYVFIYFHTTNLLARYSLVEILAELPPGEFIRVHKSYIVSINNILKVNMTALMLKSIKMPIPIGENYLMEFLLAIGQNPE